VEKNDYAQGGKIVNQRLEEVFNILPNEPEKKEELNNDIEDAIDNALVEYSAGMEITSKIDAALPIVSELNKHDEEMDDIHKKAIHTFEEVVSLAMNSDSHAGSKFLESANALLKTAMEAKDSKVDRKLKMVNLQLQKAKLDLANRKYDDAIDGNEVESEGTLVVDRNELLKRIADAEKLKNDK